MWSLLRMTFAMVDFLTGSRDRSEWLLSKVWHMEGCGEKGLSYTVGGEWTLCRPLRRTVWSCCKKLEIRTAYMLAITLNAYTHRKPELKEMHLAPMFIKRTVYDILGIDSWNTMFGGLTSGQICGTGLISQYSVTDCLCHDYQGWTFLPGEIISVAEGWRRSRRATLQEY